MFATRIFLPHRMSFEQQVEADRDPHQLNGDGEADPAVYGGKLGS